MQIAKGKYTLRQTYLHMYVNFINIKEIEGEKRYKRD
jgi:hypothetical protein